MTRPARDVTEEMFNRVREKTDWPIDTGDCLWGYFFLDTDLSKLTSAGHLLEAQGYRIAAILSDEDDPERAPSDPASYWLHVEKVECHSVDSIRCRTPALKQLLHCDAPKTRDTVLRPRRVFEALARPWQRNLSK